MRLCALVVCAASGCSSSPAPQAPTPAPLEAPSDSPTPFRVLADRHDRASNTVEYHALIAPLKHDDAQTLLEFLYRYLMQRRDPPPGGLEGHLYTDEGQLRAGAPVASVVQKPGALGPTFENRIPLEFWQQIQVALPKGSHSAKAESESKAHLPIAADPWVVFDEDPTKRTVTVYVPYTEETLTFHMAINVFSDTARALFDAVPTLAEMTFIGRWNDSEVLHIELDREIYQRLRLDEVEDSIGQIHGRAFYEYLDNRSDAEVTRATHQRMAAAYRKMLARIPKSRVRISAKLK